MEKIKKVNFYIVCIYSILTVFIIPSIDFNIKRKIFMVIFMIINIMYILYNIKYLIKIKFNIKLIIVSTILLFTTIVNITLTKYSIGFTIILILYTIIIYLSFDKNRESININRNLNKFIYVVMVISIIIQLITPKNGNNGEYTLIFVKDKNYSAVILFLFFVYCNKNKFIFGQILCVFIGLFLNSRAYEMMLIFAFIIKIFKQPIKKTIEKIKINNSYKLMVLGTISIILFSNYWIHNVSNITVKNYQEGLNDISNKMRFAANLNAVEAIKRDYYNGHLILYGYDYNIIDVWGISERQAFTHSTNYGVRVVQPHNSILNVVVKSGILISIFYFYIISKKIDIYFIDDNLEYIIPYLLNSLLLHGLLDTDYLLFFIQVISLPIYKLDRRDKNKKSNSIKLDIINRN